LRISPRKDRIASSCAETCFPPSG